MKKLFIFGLISVILATSAFAAGELTDPVAIGNIGFWAFEEGNYELAEKLFKKSLAEDPSYEHARMNLAVLYNKQERYAEAARELETLVELDGANAQYWYDLGINRIANFRYGSQEIGDFYAGLTAYESAASIDANFAHVQENLNVLYTIKEEFDL